MFRTVNDLFNPSRSRLVIAAASVALLGSMAAYPATVQAHERSDGPYRERYEHGRGPSISIQPVYRTECRRVWVEPIYQVVHERVWHEAVVQDVCDRVWVPDRWEYRNVEFIEHGHRVVRRRKILVEPGRLTEVHRQVIVKPGCWEEVQRRVIQREGHWEDVQQQVLITPGHYEDLVAVPAAPRGVGFDLSVPVCR
jgi:hypothetical protein